MDISDINGMARRKHYYSGYYYYTAWSPTVLEVIVHTIPAVFLYEFKFCHQK